MSARIDDSINFQARQGLNNAPHLIDVQHKIANLLSAIRNEEMLERRSQVIALQYALIVKVRQRNKLLAKLEANCHDCR